MSKFDMIVELMVKNGVTTKFSENLLKNLVNDEPIIELDFSEHDKVFEDKIASLEKELSSVVKEAERQEFIREMSCFERQELKQRIAELERELEKKECIKTMRIEFHADNGEMLTPLEVANSLINLSYERPLKSYEVSLSGEIAVKVKTFSVDDLKEIADYLQVYCRHHNDKEAETISF